MIDAKLKKRIAALLAMSKDASSEHEAAIAEKRLHSLLAKHNLTEACVEEQNHAHFSDEEVNWPWKRIVYNSVAQLYFCTYFSSTLRKNYALYQIVGETTNAEVARQIAKQAVTLIESLAKQSSREHYGKVVGSFCTSFHNAAANRIYQRAKELIEAAKSGSAIDEETGETLPVLASVYDRHEQSNIDFLKNQGINLKTKKASMSQKDHRGAAAGRKAGDKVSLRGGIQKKNSVKGLTHAS